MLLQSQHITVWTILELSQRQRQRYPQGLILPVFHRNYWLGLRAVQHPTFKWLDPWVKAPQPSTYMHWGSGWAGGGGREPNNIAMNEFCAVGNFTQSVRNISAKHLQLLAFPACCSLKLGPCLQFTLSAV